MSEREPTAEQIEAGAKALAKITLTKVGLEKFNDAYWAAEYSDAEKERLRCRARAVIIAAAQAFYDGKAAQAIALGISTTTKASAP